MILNYGRKQNENFYPSVGGILGSVRNDLRASGIFASTGGLHSPTCSLIGGKKAPFFPRTKIMRLIILGCKKGGN